MMSPDKRRPSPWTAGEGCDLGSDPQKTPIFRGGPNIVTPKWTLLGPFRTPFAPPERVHAGLWIRVHTCGTHGWSTHPMCGLVGSGSSWVVRQLTKVSDFSQNFHDRVYPPPRPAIRETIWAPGPCSTPWGFHRPQGGGEWGEILLLGPLGTNRMGHG